MLKWLPKWRLASPDLPPDEVRRRRREAVLIGLTAVAFAVFAVYQTRLPDFRDSPPQSSNIVFFLLINLNLILLVLLIFLVARNLVKLIFERRSRILGARLRTRLVLAFACLSLFPTVLLFLVAQGFFGSVIENWFSLRVQSALHGSAQVANRYYQQTGDSALYFADRLAREIERRGLLASTRQADLERFVEEQRAALNVGGIEVLAPAGSLAAARTGELARAGIPVGRVDVRNAFTAGQEFARAHRVGRGDAIVGGVPIRDPAGAVVGVVAVGFPVPYEVAAAARRTVRADEEYRQLGVLKQPINNSYTITFLLITLVVLFSATWFGFYFAKGITVPIQRLGEGMREVAQGNWDYRAPVGGDEEIATLVTSFNQMTAELKTIHSELEERHRYIENILENITAGVVSLDPDGAVATVNPAAASMLGISSEAARGHAWQDVFRQPELQPVADVIERMRAGQRERAEEQIRLAGGPRSLSAWVTATALTDEEGTALGTILFFEDVTFLLRVERMEAWREVARRIAHEIKNPLTPIQLSAQRLRKRYAAELTGEEAALFDELTHTIIGQVEQLKRLVNEFSTFARLPTAEVAPHDLRKLVDEALVLFRGAHRNITFELEAAPGLPPVDIDPDAIKRAMINLLDNAVHACQTVEGGGRVQVSLASDPRMDAVRLEVADNGAGMTADVQARVFEPYFSTKKDGTGLGLAIVSAIVADHHAYIRLRENTPHGVRVVIEFPLRRPDRMRAVVG
jgi:two-component system, NtrC family, nitrogen regulation sensor histidine kinase NtrY